MAEQTVSYCPNCGNERYARFCPNCGQNDRNYLRSLIPVLWEIIRETFEIDGRLFRSLRVLVSHPGELSLEFSDNRRAQYMSPIRMYLFVSILFFFTLSLSTDIASPEHVDLTGVEEQVVLDDKNLELFKGPLSASHRRKVDEIVARTDNIGRLMLLATANSLAEQSDGGLELDVSGLQRFFLGQFVDTLDNPKGALDQLMDNLPVALFVLLPVYAFLLQLFYWRSGRFYIEHLVFGIYLHTLAFLLFTLLMILPDSEDASEFFSWLSSILQLGFFAYYFLALKRYYGQGGVLTVVKFGGLLITYSMLLIPGLLLVMATTFMLI